MNGQGYDYETQKKILFKEGNPIRSSEMLLRMYGVILGLIDKAGVCTVHKALITFEMKTKVSTWERLTCIDMLIETGYITKALSCNDLEILIPRNKS